MAKWSAVCNITFNYQGETATSFGNDGVNVVGWDTTTMTIPTTGITYVAYSGPGPSGPFTFTDVDIRLNANYNPNLDATTVHEVGHAIGLDHSNFQGQVMSGGATTYTGFTSLQSDDIAGCAALYGAPGGAPPPDTQAPSVPTGLAATVISSTAIDVIWTASTDNVGVTGYKVFAGPTLLGTVATTGVHITGLTASTPYTFTVSACDAATNCSAQSAPVSATTQAAGPPPDTQAPSVPAGLAATVASSSAINLAWTASTDNVAVTSYKVFQSGFQIGTVTGTAAAVTGLAASTTYSFTVSACDAAANCSAQSAPVSATTQASGAPSDTQAPTVPAGLTAAAASSSQINLAWTASTDNVGVTAYKVFQSGVLRGTVGTVGTSITGLSASTAYSFTVSACDAAGNCSAQSAAAAATTLSAVAQPDYTGAWYNAGESGWGLSVIHGPVSGLYGIIMYHYNQSTSPTWYWMSGGSFSGNTYTVPVSLYSGPYFGGSFNPAQVSSSVVGSAAINFTSATTATMTYTINGVTVTKNIAKLDF